MKGTIRGTSYFISIEKAIEYYKSQEHNKESVLQKLREGEIHIGYPPIHQGEKILLNAEEGRYFIQE